MAKIILICGKICSGKSTYAHQIKQEHRAVILSCDELMLHVFEEQLGAQHEIILERVKYYLFQKAQDIVAAGTNVILEFGFWTAAERAKVTKLFTEMGIQVEWHYIEVSPERWLRNISSRNNRIRRGECTDYYIDENMQRTLGEQFEAPFHVEVDVWITS